MFDQSENISIDLFSSQVSEETLKMQPTMTLEDRNSQNPSNIDSTFSGSPTSKAPQGTASHAYEQHDGGEPSSWESNSNQEETQRGSDRPKLSSQDGNVEDNSETTRGTTSEEREEDMNSRASVSEINRSRIRETEKLIDILDDILREVNITEQFSRAPRHSNHPPYQPRGPQQTSIQPRAPSDSPSNNTKGGNSGDESGTVSSNTPGFEGSQKVTSEPPANLTLSSTQEAVPQTHSGTRGHRGGGEE